MAIKVTDEGGTVVIMDSNFYKYNIMKILSNTDYYYKKKPTNDDKKKQKKSVKNTKPKSCLTKKKEDYLTNSIFGQTALKKPFLKNSYILNRLDSQC